ncbi:MAG: hypothetical protein ACR2QG_10710 [Gammaproteobacteria bacterium]
MNPEDVKTKNFGIRVSLPAGDPFNALLDEGWTAEHWFATQTSRDLAMHDMQREHEYSRNGDKPTLVFEPVERGSN